MFSLGLAIALLFILLLGLTVLRALDHRPNPNTEILCELIDSPDMDLPSDERTVIPPKAKHA